MTGWDALLGSLLERLGQHGPAGKVLLCVTADRGLALGEHGVVGPCSWPHGEVAHLPLIVRFPDGAEAGRRSVPDLDRSRLARCPEILAGDADREVVPAIAVEVAARERPPEGVAGLRLVRVAGRRLRDRLTRAAAREPDRRQ